MIGWSFIAFLVALALVEQIFVRSRLTTSILAGRSSSRPRAVCHRAAR